MKINHRDSCDTEDDVCCGLEQRNIEKVRATTVEAGREEIKVQKTSFIISGSQPVLSLALSGHLF